MRSPAPLAALLQTERLDVVADLPVGEQAIVVTESLRPHLVLIDVIPCHTLAIEIAGRLRTLSHAPTVGLTSISDGSIFSGALDGLGFVAKADICSERLLGHLR
ncbi:MAG: hypothetical protein WCD11_20970 [Solirubrobacteraceae bacterium]